MDWATLLPYLMKVSIGLTVFALGLKVIPRDLTHLFRNPGLLFRSLLAMNVVMPLVAASLVEAFQLQPVVKIALVALSLSPVPPKLPKKELTAGAVHPMSSACWSRWRCSRFCSSPSVPTFLEWLSPAGRYICHRLRLRRW
jgi:hypothetical protein